MTPERFRQVRDVADAALDRAEADRAAFLATACAGNETLRAEVDSLLAAYEDVSGQPFLETPAAELASREPLAAGEEDPHDGALSPGTRLGAYELGEPLGRGGMGIVYRAVRADDEYRQVVAIKVIRRGMDTAVGQRRFREERQILAGLDHPGIARLLDGGTTDQGLPYFVMEYVDGEPIDAYSDRRRLGVADRLRLFLKVCAAVHHAHRSLVVHRDLKPGNVLVTDDGVPKLLDFGIARLVRPAGEPDVVNPTVTVLRMLTPDYASPEQVRGEPVTTATDVYSLGVLLYELLSGQRPFRAAHPHEVLAAICDVDPERPSVSVTRTGKPTAADGPALLRKKLAGDLDTIVLKALRKAPDDRYASVEAFADDVARHLDGRPVRARPHTLAYRAGKFVRRNPAAAGAAALAVFALLGGIAATTREARLADQQRIRAERRFAQVRTLANSFLFEFHDAIKDLPGATAARELVVRRALEHLDSLAAESQGDASLQAELASAYERIGDVQGEFGAANLGQSQAALQSYDKALQLREVVAGADPPPIEAQRDLATARKKVGIVRLVAGDWAAAETLFEQVRSFHASVAQSRPGDAGAEADLAYSEMTVGVARGAGGQLSDGLQRCERGLAVLERLSAADPSSVPLKHRVGGAAIWVGNLAGLTVAERPRALAAYRRSISLYEGLAAAEPANAFWRQKTADGYLGASEVAGRLGRWQEALQAARQGQAIYGSLETADPKSVYFRGERAALQHSMAVALMGLGDLESARPMLHAVEQALRALAASDVPAVIHRDRLADAQSSLGRLHELEAARATPPARRREHLRQALEWMRKADGHYRAMEAEGRLPFGPTERVQDVRRRIVEDEAALRASGLPPPP